MIIYYVSTDSMYLVCSSVAKARVDTQSRCHQTARFIEMMDKLFDCLNVTSFTARKHARKEFQDPWRPNDFRFKVGMVVSSDIVLNVTSVLYNLPSLSLYMYCVLHNDPHPNPTPHTPTHILIVA